jgi:hypothetical protein
MVSGTFFMDQLGLLREKRGTVFYRKLCAVEQEQWLNCLD